MSLQPIVPLDIESVSPETILRKDVLETVSFRLPTHKPSLQIEEIDIASVIKANIEILDSIRIPSHFDRNTLADFLERKIREKLEKDPLHKQAVELNKYANDFHTYMRQYFDKIFDFHKRLKDDLLGHVLAYSHNYLKSDFPPSFARILSFSLLSTCRFIDIYNTRIRREHLALTTYYDNRKKFERLCDRHNLWVDPTDSMIDKIECTRIGLIWYVDFANSKTVKEIFKTKVLKKSLLDKEYFFGTLVSLQRQTYQLRRTLRDLSKEAFPVSISRQDSTVDMLCSIVETMGS